MHCDRGVEILGNRVGEHAADVFERAAPDERGGTAPEHCVAPALPGRDHLVEQGLFVTLGTRVLDRVAVREIVRSLDERDVWICEVPNGGVENLGKRYMVRVQEEHELTRRHTERVIDVSGLRVRVVARG